jgi:pyridoxine 5-phosphate synthase
VELHTGGLCDAHFKSDFEACSEELKNIQEMATLSCRLGLEVHAGHGLTFETVGQVAKIPEIIELNIGHFLIGEAIFLGLQPAIRQMQSIIVSDT